MKAKHSAVLLSGVLLAMFIAGSSQSTDAPRPTCPAVSDPELQSMLMPTAWVKADWNASTSRWEIDCSKIDSLANMPLPMNAYNAAGLPANALRTRKGLRINANTINPNPYNAPTNGPNANVANKTAKPARRPPSE